MQKRYPFPFLDAYRREDHDFFFGRDEEIETLYRLTQQSNIVLLYGASGTGKTSLIRCGLSNKFKSYDWHDVYIRRGEHLIRSLDRALCEEADRPNTGSDGLTIAELNQKLEAVYKTTFKPLYLIFDQFEELYILGTKDEQQAFIDTVRHILRAEQPVKILLSIREEYLGYLYEFERQVPELLRKKLRVEPMSLDRVQQVICGVGTHPCSNVKLKAGEEEIIATRIFDKLRDQDKTLTIQLPYLQVLLDKYYLHCTGDEKRQAEATLSLNSLETLGELGDVLRSFLDEQVRYVARQQELPVETLWQLLSPFATLDGTKEPLSEDELRSRLPDDFPLHAAAPALQAFVQRRVLRYLEQTARYEVAHDALAKQLHARRSEEEIARLEAQRLIRSLVAVKPEAREPLSVKQLTFISEVLPKLRLTEEEKAWVEESRRYREEEAQKALAARQERDLSIFESFAALGKNLIYTLDHAEALEKMKVAVEVDVDAEYKRRQLAEPIAELLFFFAEGGRRPKLACTAAELLLRLQPEAGLAALLQECLNQGRQTRARFTPLLEQLPSYSQLRSRYYPEMVDVPLGDTAVFEMGSPDSEWGHQDDEQLRLVQLSPYRMAATPVTFYQFALFCEATDRALTYRTPYWGRFGDHPAVNVSWYEAVEYANWLNAQQGLPPVYTIKKVKNSDPNNRVDYDYLRWEVVWSTSAGGFRLPTEAEWELAARGGVGAVRTLYAGSDTLEEVGWYWENSGDKPLNGDWDANRILDNNGRTRAVKQKKPNGIGLYDMSGNVWEWCWDWYSPEYYKECARAGAVKNPAGPETGRTGRVRRGGSWSSEAVHCRAAYRRRNSPDYRYHNVGFRLVFVLQLMSKAGWLLLNR